MYAAAGRPGNGVGRIALEAAVHRVCRALALCILYRFWIRLQKKGSSRMLAKSVGEFSKCRPRKPTAVKRHTSKKRTMFTTRRQTHVSGGGATWGLRAHTEP